MVALSVSTSARISPGSTSSPTSFNMAQALLEWRGNFNFLEEFLLVTDNASHFSNNLLKVLRRALKYSQRFSVANAPFTNGTIETVNKEVLTNLKQLCSEFKIKLNEWPLLLPLKEFVINNKIMKRKKIKFFEPKKETSIASDFIMKQKDFDIPIELKTWSIRPDKKNLFKTAELLSNDVSRLNSPFGYLITSEDINLREMNLEKFEKIRIISIKRFEKENFA